MIETIDAAVILPRLPCRVETPGEFEAKTALETGVPKMIQVERQFLRPKGINLA